MRTIALFAVVSLCACGTVCDGVAQSEQAANAKGQACNASYTVHDSNKCNQGLHSCNSDDLQTLDNYARCLNNLQQCTNDTKASFTLAEAGCLIDLTHLSFNCANAIR